MAILCLRQPALADPPIIPSAAQSLAAQAATAKPPIPMPARVDGLPNRPTHPHTAKALSHGGVLINGRDPEVDLQEAQQRLQIAVARVTALESEMMSMQDKSLSYMSQREDDWAAYFKAYTGLK